MQARAPNTNTTQLFLAQSIAQLITVGLTCRARTAHTHTHIGTNDGTASKDMDNDSPYRRTREQYGTYLTYIHTYMYIRGSNAPKPQRQRDPTHQNRSCSLPVKQEYMAKTCNQMNMTKHMAPTYTWGTNAPKPWLQGAQTRHNFNRKKTHGAKKWTYWTRKHKQMNAMDTPNTMGSRIQRYPKHSGHSRPGAAKISQKRVNLGNIRPSEGKPAQPRPRFHRKCSTTYTYNTHEKQGAANEDLRPQKRPFYSKNDLRGRPSNPRPHISKALHA